MERKHSPHPGGERPKGAARPRRPASVQNPRPKGKSPAQQAPEGEGCTPCPVYRKCGGCQLQNLSYARQLAWKQDRCQKILGKFGRIAPILGMDNPYHYRNKVQAAFSFDKRHGRIISGVYQSSTHRIVPIDSCQTEDEIADRIIVTVRGLLKSFKLTAFDEVTGRGFLRHVLVKRAFATGQVMVVLVTGTPVFTAKKHFVAELLRLHPEITTILQNVNNRQTSMVLGEQEKVLYGPGCIVDQLCGCKFRISAKSFYQINPVQTEVLYNKAMEFAGLSGREKVLDAYCGIGTIGLVAANRGAGQVLGVEVNPDAVKDAIQNARENGVKNAYFTCGDAGELLQEAALQGERWDVVFMDPPRAGASREFLTALCACGPKRVVYISCDPETLSRDLGILQANHYRIKAIQPVDMFPHTQHIETVVKLVRKTPDAYIDITVDMDELDLTTSEAKVTYQKIKDYIEEKYDVKVSSLYIAQVKQKYGIIERKNYNTAKSKNVRQPQCPPEKEKLIEEAMRHFKMIS